MFSESPKLSQSMLRFPDFQASRSDSWIRLIRFLPEALKLSTIKLIIYYVSDFHYDRQQRCLAACQWRCTSHPLGRRPSTGLVVAAGFSANV